MFLKEELLEEIEAAKHCIEMAEMNISHAKTRESILTVLNKRILELQADVDATLAAKEFGDDMMMDVA